MTTVNDMRQRGKITSWKPDKGFGFIRPEGGSREIFAHISDFKTRARVPVPGEAVSFSIALDDDVRPVAQGVLYADESLLSLLPSGIFSLLVSLGSLCGLALMTRGGRLPPVIFIAMAVLSLATFVAYWRDKQAAEQGRWRVPEAMLHFFSMAGGWPGALLAQCFLRHKSSKKSFRIIFYLTVLINGAIIWCIMRLKSGL